MASSKPSEGLFGVEDLTRVPRGWSVGGWRRYWLAVAEACEQQHPERAAQIRQAMQSMSLEGGERLDQRSDAAS